MTQRDKWLAVFLPTILTAIIYIFGSGYSAGKALSAARTEAFKAHEAVPSAQALSERMKIFRELSLKLATEKERVKLLRVPSVAAVSTPGTRAETLRTVSDVLTQKQLSLVKSVRLSDGTQKDSQGNAGLNKLAEQLGMPAPELWQMDITGTYRNMRQAIDALEKSGKFVVPLSISMEPMDYNSGTQAPKGASVTQSWALTLWI